MEPIKPTETLLIFRVGTMHIGAAVDSIVSIIPPPTTIPLPTRGGDSIRVFSYQDEPALAIGMRDALGIAVDEDTPPGCIILTRLEDKLIGFWIDEAVDMAQPETYRITDADPEVWLSGGPFDYVCERNDTMILHTTFENLGEYSNGLSGEIWAAANHARLDQIEQVAAEEKTRNTAEEKPKVHAATLDEKEKAIPATSEVSKPTEPEEGDQHIAAAVEDISEHESVVPVVDETVPDTELSKSVSGKSEPRPLPAKRVVAPHPKPEPERQRPVIPANRVSQNTEQNSVKEIPVYRPTPGSQHDANQPKSRWPYVILLLLFILTGVGWWLYDSTLTSGVADNKSIDPGDTPLSSDRPQSEAGGNTGTKTMVYKDAPESIKQPQTETEGDVLIETEEFTIVVERNQQSKSPLEPTTEAATAPRPESNDIIVHVVVKGDTLWHIAKRYIGDPFRFPELARLSQIKDPDWIYPGNIVRIIKKQKPALPPDASEN